ncbi:hypothetical protein CH063_03989 [Colletotrichum higginsianum]|uniref:Uncharacterized protein n=1 Tax=Colletotrichum higginsianum (strain IMI 349063) TaxID=759273 RepID=H1W351_COLHI|nr:hypothetical protein CH063_03989 [Colletotrichum higginsianum]
MNGWMDGPYRLMGACCPGHHIGEHAIVKRVSCVHPKTCILIRSSDRASNTMCSFHPSSGLLFSSSISVWAATHIRHIR